MKKCEQCNRTFIINVSRSYFCTRCGGELIEIIEAEKFCPNPECKRYTGEHRFMEYDNYCDYCGVSLVDEGGLE